MIDETWLKQALQVARQAGEAAADVIAYYRKQSFTVEYKADDSPVTVADKEAESAIRATLFKHYPDHAIYGEEQGREGDSDFLWLVDPLDGTKSFVAGTPFYSTQIALMYQGTLLLGVSAAPHFGETAWAYRGGGAWLDDKPIRVSDVDRFDRAGLSGGNLRTLSRDTSRWCAYGDIVGQVNRVRGYGDFCHYHLLARGALDLVIESDVNILDIAAMAVIVREAGGTFTDLEGRELDLDTRSVLAATPALHRQALSKLAKVD